MWPRNLSALALIALLGACAPWHSTTDKIWSVGEKRYLSEAEALDRIAAAPIVLLGESHDNADHHRLQADVVAGLAARGQKRSLAFEMIEQDRQPAIDAYVKSHPASAQGLGEAVDWAQRGWPDYAMYAPIFQAGLTGGWAIRAANLAKSQMKAAGTPGGLGALEEKRLGLADLLPAPLAFGLKQDLIDGHCGLLPESALPAMMRLQIAWDGSMASTLNESRQADGALLIAGAEHVRKDRAVPFHLARLNPGLKVLAVAFKEQTEPPAPPDSATWPYDLVWFTPAKPEVDHCAKLREKMGKKKP